MILDKIIISDIAPKNTGVVWIKPVDDSYEQYIHLNGKWVKIDKAADIFKNLSNALTDNNINISNAISAIQAQIETITGTKPDNIYRVIYDVDWSRIKADHNDYTNGVNHFEIIDKQDDEVLWAEVYCNTINSGNVPCNNKYSYQIVDNKRTNRHRFYEEGNLNVPFGYDYEGGGSGGSITNNCIFTVKVRAAKILKFIDPVMEKALSYYYSHAVTNTEAYGVKHVEDKLLDVEAERITALGTALYDNSSIREIWKDLKTTEDFKLLHNLTAFNGPVIASSTTYYPKNLDTLYIPKSLKEINGFPITYISDFTLKHIIVEEGNSVFDSRDNCDCLIRTADNTMIGGCMNSKIPASVTAIDGWWFGKGIKRLSLPDTLTSWPSTNTDMSPAHYKTFPDLEYLKLSAGIKEYNSTIVHNASLKEVVIPEGVEIFKGIISERTMYIKRLELPSTITNTGPGFYSLNTNITLPDVIIHYKYTQNSILFGSAFTKANEVIFDNDAEVRLPNNVSVNKITFTDNCKHIPAEVASNQPIKELNIGKGLQTIPSGAFAYDSELKEIIIPKNITLIDVGAFYNTEPEKVIIKGNPELKSPSFRFNNGVTPDVYFYTEPPVGIEEAFADSHMTIYVKPEYLEQWQAVEFDEATVTIKTF